jgi:pimeloyl-ACP methyl ester carboxylesterase
MENEADVLRDLVIKLDVRNVILFGHSDGGSIALIAAGKYPSEFEAVVVEAAHVFVEEVTLTGIRAALYDYETTDLKSRLEKYHGNKTDTLFKAWTETWLSDNFRSWNIEHFLTNIKCPVLFIQGEEDEYGSAQQVHAVEQQVSGRAEAYLVPQIHHTPHKEAADIVIEKSVSFLLPLL